MRDHDLDHLERLHERGGETTTGLTTLLSRLTGPATMDWETRIHYVAKAQTWGEAVARSYEVGYFGDATQ